MTEKITLSKPIMVQGEEVTELTLAEPTLGALDGVHVTISGGESLQVDLGDIPKVLAALANIPVSSARKVSWKDIRVVMEPVMDFLSG